MTLSITWMTPLEHMMSAFTTFAVPLRVSDSPLTARAMSFLFKAVALLRVTAVLALTLPATTW